MNKIWNAVIFMTLYFQKKPQRDFVFHFFFNLYYSLFILFFLLFIFFLQHADVHATACWRIGSYASVRTGIWGIHKSSVMNNTLTHMESRLYHILHTVQTLHPLPFGWTQSSKERLRVLTTWKPPYRWKCCISVYEHHPTKWL